MNRKERRIKMDRITALKMNNEVVNFLCEHGNFPSIKKVDERILKAERKLENKLLKLQAGVESEFIKELRKRSYLPSNTADQRRLISKILEVPFNDMKTVIADEGVKSAELGRQITFDELIDQGLKVTFREFNDTVKDRLFEKIYKFSEDTFSRIEGDFVQTLTNGYEDGLGIDDVARNLKDDFKNLRDHRLKNIARTEIQSTQNEGASQTLKDYNVKYKQWLTVGDNRVRGDGAYDEYDHISLHGQVVRADERYSNGMMYPADRSGDIGDWINCRCRERPYIPSRDEKILSTPYYP